MSKVHISIKVSFIALLIISTSIDINAQVTQQEIDEWNRQDFERQERAIRENLYRNHHPKPTFLDQFLGNSDGDWVISIFSEGGIFGTRMLGSVSSRKQQFCSFDGDNVKTSDLAQTAFDGISKTFNDLRLRPRLSLAPKSSELRKYCKDCSWKSLSISKRDTKGITYDVYLVGEGKPDIDTLFEQVNNLQKCSE